MSNFTDFNILERTPEIALQYTASPTDILNADCIIIPGSKNPIADLHHLRKSGMAQAIIQAHESGKSVYGICGGFQMMGTSIHDPHSVENETPAVPGLGILPVTTTLTQEKTTEQRTFSFMDSKEPCKGYEIHMGKTETDAPSPLCTIDGKSDGYFLNTKTWGSYIHGIFDNTQVIDSLLLSQGHTKSKEVFDMEAFKKSQYDALADVVRESCDLSYVYSSLQQP